MSRNSGKKQKKQNSWQHWHSYLDINSRVKYLFKHIFMKKIFFLPAIYIVLFGCNNNQESNESKNVNILQEEHAIADTITLLQLSQLSFDDALNNIRAGKKTEAATVLKKALLQLRTEKENMNIPEVKEKMEYVVNNIQAVTDSLEDGRNINLTYLRKNISQAELLLARHYFINIEVPEAVDKTYVAMDKTIELMEAGLIHNDDINVKQDAGTIVKDTRVLLQKAKDNKELHKEELKKHAERIKTFLEQQTKEYMIHIHF
jgi:uncharacterized lipoprotein NlpE involved in copper resistance